MIITSHLPTIAKKEHEALYRDTLYKGDGNFPWLSCKSTKQVNFMVRKDIETHMRKTYGCEPEYPWIKLPDYAVYRHSENRKWFAVVMDLSKRKFGFDEDTVIDVMNVKCDPILIGSLLSQKGIFPAYHMNKGTWISVFLDGSVSQEEIKCLIDISFDSTMKKTKSQR